MTRREKVIAALEHCAAQKTCDKCPMTEECKGVYNAAMAAALELLKAQEPAKPRYDRGYRDYNCPVCGVYLLFHQKYCNECGKALQWE